HLATVLSALADSCGACFSELLFADLAVIVQVEVSKSGHLVLALLHALTHATALTLLHTLAHPAALTLLHALAHPAALALLHALTHATTLTLLHALSLAHLLLLVQRLGCGKLFWRNKTVIVSVDLGK